MSTIEERLQRMREGKPAQAQTPVEQRSVVERLEAMRTEPARHTAPRAVEIDAVSGAAPHVNNFGMNAAPRLLDEGVLPRSGDDSAADLLTTGLRQSAREDVGSVGAVLGRPGNEAYRLGAAADGARRQADRLEEERQALLLPMQSSQGATQSFSDIWGTMSQADELQKKIDALRQEESEYRIKSETAGYQNMFLDPDFDKKSVRQPSNEYDKLNETWKGALTDRHMVALDRDGSLSSDWVQRAAQMTDDEFALYNYIRNTEGQESANRFLDYLEETLNYRVGNEQAGIIKDIESPIGRAAAYGLYGTLSGLDQAGTGLKQLFSKEALPTTYSQFGSSQAREDLSSAGPKLPEWAGGASIGQVAFDLTKTTANMVPSIAAGTLFGPGAGAAMIGSTSAGNAYGDALKQGYSEDDAFSYGVLSGAVEAGLSYELGCIGSLGGKVTGNAASKLVSSIDRALLRVATSTEGKSALVSALQRFGYTALRTGANIGVKGAGEGFEEYLTEVLSPVIRNITLNENNQFNPISEDAIYSGILGALSGAAMNVTTGVTGVDNTDAEINRAYSDMMESGIFGRSPLTLPTAGDIGRYGTSTADAWYDRNVWPEPGGSTGTQAQKNASTIETVTHRMTMEDFTNVNSPVWNNVEYGDTETQSRITRQTHQAMVEEGAVVTVPQGTMEQVGQSYPDLRGMKKAERTPILRQKMKELKASLRQFLNGLKGGSYEFNVNGNILEARLYDTGVREVLEKIDRSKASMLYHSDQVFRNARYLYSTPDYDGDPNVYRWNYFYTPVQIGGEIVGVRIAVRDMVRQTDGSMDSQIYNWGIKTGAALDGGERGNMPDRSDVSSATPEGAALDGGRPSTKPPSSDVSSAAPDGMTLGTSASSVNPSRSSIPQSGGENNINPEQAGVDAGAKRGGFGENTVGAAENPYGYQQRQSRVGSNTFSKMYREVLESMEQDGGNVTDLPYDVVTERQSMEHAKQRLSTDLEGEIADLPQKDAWSGEDLDTAMGILDRYMAEAKESRDYTKVNEWARLIQTRGTSGGQFIQAFAKYSRTPQGILVDAVKALDNSRLNEQRKNQVMDHVRAQVEALDSLQDGDKQSVIDLIKESSRIRRTGTLFRNRISAPLERALQADSYEHLKKVAAAQVDSIAKDYERQSTAGRIRDLRSMFMLSNVATTLRNLLGNGAFGGLDAFAGSTGGVPLDILLSKFTGTRSVAAENPMSLTALKGMRDGALKSYIEVALDADPSGVESRYGTTSNRSFKMTGSPLERFLSTWSKYMGYALNTTDEMAKGGARASVQRGIDRLTERGLVRDDSLSTRADEIAKYRTFQDDTALSRGMRGVRNALNYAGVGPARGGSPHSFGAGDILMPFDRVPANLVSRSLEYSPLGLANGAREVANVLWKAHKGTLTAAEQARAVSAVSRGMTGTGLIALFATLASAGLLRVAGNGEGEEDKTALETSEGLSGTQVNLSGFLRWVEAGNLPKLLPGGEAPDPIEWRDGDEIMSIGFLDPINAQMTTGALLAQELKENPEADRLGTFGMASLEGTLQSLLDLPAMSSLQALANGYNYSDADTTGGRVGDALISYGASQVSSFIPNIVRAAARAGDPYVRDTYSSGTPIGEMVDSIKAGIPGLRQTLPIRQTPFGADRTYGDNQTMNALNAMLMPGARTTYRTSDAAQELYGLPSVDDNPIYPRRNAPNTVSFNGNDYELTPEQKTQYQKTYGQTYRQLIDDLRVSSYYKGLDPEEQTRLLSDARAYANDKAKREALEANGVDYQSSSWEKAYQAEQAGVPMEAYFTYRARRNELEDSADKEVARSANATIRREIMDDSSLTDAQKSALDRYLLNDITVIPKDMNVDYSNEESFLISQMSDSAQRRWPGIRDRFGLSAEEYQEAVRIYNMDKDDGVTTADKKRMLRELFGQYGNAIYKALGEKIEDDEN